MIPTERDDVKPFDFRHPSTMPREHIRTLQIVQESLARGISATLATSLRSVVDVTIKGLEQSPYEDYIRALPNPSILTTLALPPMVGEVALEVSLPLAFTATEIMLGGSGAGEQPERAMTDLEKRLMRNFVELILPVLTSAFEPILPIQPTITAQESNPQFLQIASPTDMVVVISFQTTIENVPGQVRFAIPQSVLAPHLEDLVDKVGYGALSETRIAEDGQRLREHVGDAEVEVVARFRPLIAGSSDVARLGVGDLLLLNHAVDLPLTMEVDGVPLHDVSIGRVSRHLAVQVQGSVEPDRHQKRQRLHTVRSSPEVA